MEKILLNLSIILFTVYFYKKIRHGLHILQLENYYNDRYAVWMKKNIKTVLNIKTIGMLAIPIILLAINQTNIAFALEILAYLALIVTSKKKKEKKPFVVTARIRRMYMTFLVLLAIVFGICNFSNVIVATIVINVLASIAYTFVYIVNLINRPIEKSIRHGFCKKAHKKLKDVPGLKVIGITGS